jgi:Tfp pilus assembly protein PilN
MTALTDRLAKPKTGKPSTSIVVGLPQVNLLPPEVRAARGLRSIKRWLVIALLVTIALCGLLYVVNIAQAQAADDELMDAQSETARLTLEQAKYAEVPRVLNQLDVTNSTRTIAMSTDVLWKSYLDAITAVLPEGVSLDVVSMTGATPMTPLAAPASVLQSARVGEIVLTGRSLSLPDTAALIDELNSIPGLGDAWVTAAVVDSDPEFGIYYKIDGSVQVRAGAFSDRFEPVDTDGGK